MILDTPPAFRFHQVRRPEDEPPVDPRVVDVAILDFNHDVPNLGHDSLVRTVASVARVLEKQLLEAGVCVRVLSYPVRSKRMLPEPPPGRFGLYLGTGGPGHIDPNQNDGVASWAYGIREDPSWEPAAHRLFEAIKANPEAAMLAVCHTFGVLCRWSGVAKPILRGPEKGGRSHGLLENLLSEDACQHPWFSRFGELLEGGKRLFILDNRQFDLIPNGRMSQNGSRPIGYEVTPAGERGNALTMYEWARDAGGVMPRFFAVNHHPEIYDWKMQYDLVEAHKATHQVSAKWLGEKQEVLDSLSSEETSERIRLTSRITLLGPLRFHLYRRIRLTFEALGSESPVHENDVLDRAPSARGSVLA